MSTTTDKFSVSFPQPLSRELAKIAKREGRTRSAILRDAFKSWRFRQELAGFQMIGRRKAMERGIESEEDLLRLLT